jgi:hypothetical protein
MIRTSRLLLALAAPCVFAVPAHADETLHHSRCDAVKDSDLHAMALDALKKRKYTIESDTPESIVAAQDKYKVEIAFSPHTVEIRWQGKPGPHEYWIRNLKTDILWALAE